MPPKPTPRSIPIHPVPRRSAEKSRGAVSTPQGRFERDLREAFDDGWHEEHEAARPAPTVVTAEEARTILSRNTSPDIPFELSLNPYRGCEHGCIYCFARPTHAYLELSPGLDFETRIFAKVNAAELLRRELSRPGHRVSPIALGVNTDAYQPAERQHRITRSVLEVLAECRHPVSLITKSSLIERDIDLLAPMAALDLCRVYISLTTLDHATARRLDPRAASPARRIATLRALSRAGIPTGIMVAPVIPALNDNALEAVLAAAADAGATSAGYVMLRLPHELRIVFQDWRAAHFPERAAHVMSRLRDVRNGRENDPRFGTRMRGTGKFADLIAQRFAIACRRSQLNMRERGAPAGAALDCSKFHPPAVAAGPGHRSPVQPGLFDADQ